VRALIFGGTGMLGRAVVREARHRGQPALALSRRQADVTDRERLLYWADVFRPEVVFNCAAFTRVDECESDPEKAFAVNGAAVEHVAAAAAAVGAALVQVSTDYVFDGAAGEPYPEEAEPAPLSVYGRSKLAGERAATGYDRSLVVRTSWLFGAGGHNFVAAMVHQVEAGRRLLRVVDDQQGRPTYTSYLARALWDLTDRGATGVVHYANREPTTWCGFAREIVQLWDTAVEVEPVPTEAMPRPAPRPRWSVLDVGTFERMVGRRVEPWGLGLVEYLATWQGRRARP
jgi:dTDP-4-dehydrorhamnose reductase